MMYFMTPFVIFLTTLPLFQTLAERVRLRELGLRRQIAVETDPARIANLRQEAGAAHQVRHYKKL